MTSGQRARLRVKQIEAEQKAHRSHLARQLPSIYGVNAKGPLLQDASTGDRVITKGRASQRSRSSAAKAYTADQLAVFLAGRPDLA